MKIWITGGDGFVGKAVQKRCQDEGIEFVATSHTSVDITAATELKTFLKHQTGLTHLVNCAAYTDVDKAEKEPQKAYQVNTVGPELLGEAAKQNDLKMVHLSTDYVFSGGTTPFVETDPCTPVNVYAQTKLDGERRLLEANPYACIVRTSWVFGPGGKNFVSSLFSKFKHEEKIYVSAEQKNRLTYVHDLAEVILALLCHTGIFHFANRGIVSRFEVATLMLKLVQAQGLSTPCQEVLALKEMPQGAKRPLYSALDTTKIEGALSKFPRPWQEAMKECLCEI
jgi:dTDP-4-dehydrorhamnose reductase